eukprot:COSAG04_NODE_2106_length_4770_cov_6.166774_3_plen_88_part_00
MRRNEMLRLHRRLHHGSATAEPSTEIQDLHRPSRLSEAADLGGSGVGPAAAHVIVCQFGRKRFPHGPRRLSEHIKTVHRSGLDDDVS